MTYISGWTHAPRAARGIVAAAAAARRLWRRLEQAHAANRADAALASMDEHLLRDIGVRREDARRVVRYGRD